MNLTFEYLINSSKGRIFNSLKVPKCEILMSWILMIFYHEVYIGRGLEGWNKMFTFFTDGWDTGHFVLATACAVYASKVLPHAPHTPAICYRMRRLLKQNTQFYTVLLPHAACTLANCYRMRRLRYQFATAYASKVLPYAPSTLTNSK